MKANDANPNPGKLRSRAKILVVSALLAVVALLLVGGGTLSALAQQLVLANRLYLPMVLLIPDGQTNPGPTVTPTVPPTTTPVPSQGLRTFMESEKKTGSAALAVDAQGGLHVAYTYMVPQAEDPTARYQYCPANKDCAVAANWTGVSLSVDVYEVQLVLAPSGGPRLLVLSESVSQSGGKDYSYYQCDQGCTSPAGWTGGIIFTTNGTSIADISRSVVPQRYFDLDPQGRPRFVYYDRNYMIEPDHWGSFYAACDSDCTLPENWTHTLIGQLTSYDAEIYEYPSLDFTSTGQPRVVTNVYAIGESESGLYYVTCDQNCDDSANWQRVRLSDRGYQEYVAWDIEVDSQDRPRIAFFKGTTDEPDKTGNLLYYLWCDQNCLTAGSWTMLNLGLDFSIGQDADLVLDAQDRPRIAHFVSGNTLAYSTCDANCSDAASWNHEGVDDSGQLAQEWPVPLPVTCDAGLWDSLTPVMALDPQGSPVIAYDSVYNARCLYDDPTDNQPPYYRFHALWYTVRLVQLP